jgi:hypothetical protein
LRLQLIPELVGDPEHCHETHFGCYAQVRHHAVVIVSEEYLLPEEEICCGEHHHEVDDLALEHEHAVPQVEEISGLEALRKEQRHLGEGGMDRGRSKLFEGVIDQICIDNFDGVDD